MEYRESRLKTFLAAAPGLRAPTRSSSHLIDSSDAIGLSAIRDGWEHLALTTTDFLAFHQSPMQWDLARLAPKVVRSFVAVTRGPGGTIDAIAPTVILDHSFSLRLVKNLRATQPLRVVRILGDQPLVRVEDGTYAQMFRFLLESNHDCDGIWLVWLPFESRCWRAILNSPEFQREIIVHAPNPPDYYSLINLPASFEIYLNRFKGKTRYNLRRQLNRLSQLEGELRCVRITDAAQVPSFLAAASAVNSLTPVYKGGARWSIATDAVACETLAALANSGIMRGYLLKCGEHVRAFVFGYQYRDIYYYHRIGFDERLAPYSPGTVLLYLLLEDLFHHRPPRCVYLGHGGMWNTGPFGTDFLPGTEVLLLRRSVKTQLWVGASTLHRFARRLLRR
jgi:GNAT acetyltransferase-like protein